jgi:membrane protease subunit HflK
MSNDEPFDPWSPTPSKGSKKKPAGQTPPPNNNKQQPNPEDLEKAMKELGEKWRQTFNGDDGKNIKRALLAVLAVWLFFSCVFMLTSGEKAVILRFGEYHRTADDGLNFKLPYPIEEKYVRDTARVNRLEIGSDQTDNLMVTSDENIANVKFTVQWKIKDLKGFLFNLDIAEQSVQNASESAMREVIGNTKLSVALGEGKGRSLIADECEEILQKMLDTYKAGVEVVDISLRSVDVPKEVVDAQIDVQNAKTEQEKLKNQAEAYANDLIPRARGEAQQLIQEAEGYKQAQIAKATGDAARFNKVYEQYQNAPAVTRRRMYLETMQDVMQGMDKVIIDEKGSALPIMQIEGVKKPL